jgi:predicted porin
VYAAGFASDYAAGGEGRIDGALFYTSPSISGLTLSVSMSPKKLTSVTVPAVAATPATADKVETLGSNAVPGVTSTKTHQSISAVYTAGPLVAGLGHEQNRVGDTITQVFGNYNMGVAKLFASYATIEGGTAADRAGVTFAASSAGVNSGAMSAAGGVAAGGEIKNWTVGATVPMGATTILVGYSGWNGNGLANQQDDTKFGIGAKYDLSKRTFLQASYATQTRKNNTGTRPDRDNTKQAFFDVGIAHSF